MPLKTPPDYNSCTEKKRCCETGIVYDPADPCTDPDFEEFDADLCACRDTRACNQGNFDGQGCTGACGFWRIEGIEDYYNPGQEADILVASAGHPFLSCGLSPFCASGIQLSGRYACYSASLSDCGRGVGIQALGCVLGTKPVTCTFEEGLADVDCICTILSPA